MWYLQGLMPNYVKVVPSIAIAFVFYEQVGLSFPWLMTIQLQSHATQHAPRLQHDLTVQQVRLFVTGSSPAGRMQHNACALLRHSQCFTAAKMCAFE